MNTVYLLGAGASHCYSKSTTGVQPPLANGFFNTYAKLRISEDFEVRVGDIVNYVRDYHALPPEKFNYFNMNVEAFMTEVDDKLIKITNIMKERKLGDKELGDFYSLVKTYDQMIFLFAHVINETQNGTVSDHYSKLASICDGTDTLVTLNWDTLLDRALFTKGDWFPDSGYGVTFRKMLDNDWRNQSNKTSSILLIKLHGSVNWLVNYVSRDMTTGERVMMTGHPNPGRTMITYDFGFSVNNRELQSRPEANIKHWGTRTIPLANEIAAIPCCFIRGTKPFSSYRNRYRAGYADFSYFFPPNDEIDDIPMMPLIVPPTHFKMYNEFQHVLDPLWQKAQDRISEADRIIIIGYSFPFVVSQVN